MYVLDYNYIQYEFSSFCIYGAIFLYSNFLIAASIIAGLELQTTLSSVCVLKHISHCVASANKTLILKAIGKIGLFALDTEIRT